MVKYNYEFGYLLSRFNTDDKEDFCPNNFIILKIYKKKSKKIMVFRNYVFVSISLVLQHPVNYLHKIIQAGF